ncbi:hypothetical protein [Shewanella xiamenensis]|uniref:hypothetical protein n=1 Tax=Shewanella xiamenensis TaxID=332186 RepID=UPI001FD625F9|nr:hypothetical protein [Shewanella xiamenensis]
MQGSAIAVGGSDVHRPFVVADLIYLGVRHCDCPQTAGNGSGEVEGISWVELIDEVHSNSAAIVNANGRAVGGDIASGNLVSITAPMPTLARVIGAVNVVDASSSSLHRQRVVDTVYS